MPDLVANLENPSTPSLSLWSTTLQHQMDERRIPLQELTHYQEKLTVKSLRHWLNAQHSPQRGQLRLLALATLDAGVWDTLADVIDWMALLGWSTQETIELLGPTQEELELRDSAKTDPSKGSTAKVQAFPPDIHWHPATLLPPEMADYLERDIEAEIISALLSLESFRQPQSRAVVISSRWPAEARALIVRLIRQPNLQDFFRDGIYWMEGHATTPKAALSVLMEGVRQTQRSDAAPPSSDFTTNRQTWRAWASPSHRNALVVIDALEDPRVFKPIITNAGPQVRYLMTTSLNGPELAELHHWLGAQHTFHRDLPGYSTTEIERFLQIKTISLNGEERERLEYVRELSHGTPELLRWCAQAISGGAETSLPSLIDSFQKRGWVAAVPALLRCDPDTIDRPEILQAVRQAARDHPGQPIVLHGPSGIGKTTLLNLIANDPVLRLQFPDGIMRVKPSQNKAATTLSAFQSAMLILDHDLANAKMNDWVSYLRTRLMGKRVLLFLEDWIHAQSARWLLKFTSADCLMILTTESDTLARSLNLPSSCVILVPGFTLAEIEEYMERRECPPAASVERSRSPTCS